ncbi:retrovirus-related pol polyprotein from transposon TNT 1-94 [Tanacetum coccineum]
MTESPLIESGFAVPVFSPRYDPIACLYKAMAFLIDGRQGQSYSGTGYKSNATSFGGNKASGQARVVKCYICQGEGHMARQCTQPKRPRNVTWYKEKIMLAEAQEAGQILDEEQLAFLADPGVPDGQAVQTIILNNASFQTEDLDTYDSDCDDISNAQAVLMVNISNYGSDVISELWIFLDNEIHSDSNIILYCQYLEETQQENVQDTHLQTQQDSMILSVIEQMSEQMINHVNNWEKANKEHNHESVTAELERYKERVKTFEQRLNIDLSSREKMIDSQMDDMIREKLALKEQVDSLEKNLSKQIKEKECLLQTFTVFKNESKEKEDKYMENEIDLEKKIKELDNILFKVDQSAQTVHMLTKPQAFYDNIHKQALGYQNPFHLKNAQRIKPTLYDGIVMSDKHVAMPVIDDEETLILEENSRSKMSEKAKDPEIINKNISHKPIDYEKLNRLYEDFRKRFTPQQEMDGEQAFWLRISNLTSKPSDASLVKIEVPKKLPKVSLVNESLKKLKFHLARFDNVVKIRTTPDAHTEGKRGFKHTKVVFNNEIIPFLKSLKDIFNVSDKDLLHEIMEVQTIFNQMDAAVQQFSVDKQCLKIAMKELPLENDRLLQQIMSQEVLLTVMNSMSMIGESVNMDGKRKETCNLEAELLKSKNAFNDLLKRHSQLEKHCTSLECSIQLNQEIFQKRESCDNQNALAIPEFFENNDLKAQLQDKDNTIYKLKDIIKSMREKFKEENVKYDYYEIDTKNIELENSVAKLILENKRLCNEINHVKQVFKEQFDSIKKTRVHSKEQHDSLIDKLNLKSVENEDLKAQIQDKVFVITSLKNDLQQIKGKGIVDIAAQIPSANTIVPGMFKLDLEPLAPRLLQNREDHIDYLKYTQEQADILWGIVKQAKVAQPLDKELDFACKYAQQIQELLVYVRDTCPNVINLSAKKVVATPKNKDKKVRIEVNMKNKVEAQPRKVNKENRVVEPICNDNVKHSKLNVNSDLNCATCKKSLFDDVHDKCLLDFVKTVNSHAKSAKKHKKQNIWKPTGHVFSKVGFKWKPTGRTFTIVGNLRPLTRITSANVVPPKKTTSHSVETQKPELKVYSRKPKYVKKSCPDCSLVSGLWMFKIHDRESLLAHELYTNWYTISLDDMLKTSPICLLSKVSKTKSWLWHRWLSHLNFGTLNKLAKDALARGILRLKFQKDHLCSACALGKSKKSSHQPKAKDTNQEKLYILHMGLCGPMSVVSINGKRYILVIVDDYSRFTWVGFLRTKDKAPEAIIKCIKNIQVRLNATVRNVRRDNGTEFVNQILREFYENVGISHQTSIARTSQQNGIVERQNRSLIEDARTMLIFSKAPLFLWAKAINTACYTQNRSLICLRYNKTPYELMQDKKLDLSFFYVLSELCYTTNDNDDLGKLHAKTYIGIFVGYTPAKKAFRIYNKRTRKIIETIHVTFDELTAMASEQFSSGPELYSMTPATSSLGLVPNTVSQQPCIPPKRDDWDHLFQPMFDEYFTPPSIAFSLVQEVAASRAAVLTDSPVSTSID